MNAIKWFIVLSLYTVFAVAVAVFHWRSDPLFWESGFLILHPLNIGMGIYNLVSCVDMGMRYGWKS